MDKELCLRDECKRVDKEIDFEFVVFGQTIEVSAMGKECTVCGEQVIHAPAAYKIYKELDLQRKRIVQEVKDDLIRELADSDPYYLPFPDRSYVGRECWFCGMEESSKDHKDCLWKKAQELRDAK